MVKNVRQTETRRGQGQFLMAAMFGFSFGRWSMFFAFSFPSSNSNHFNSNHSPGPCSLRMPVFFLFCFFFLRAVASGWEKAPARSLLKKADKRPRELPAADPAKWQNGGRPLGQFFSSSMGALPRIWRQEHEVVLWQARPPLARAERSSFAGPLAVADDLFLLPPPYRTTPPAVKSEPRFRRLARAVAGPIKRNEGVLRWEWTFPPGTGPAN